MKTTLKTYGTLFFAIVFFLGFVFYPLSYVFKQSVYVKGHFSPAHFLGLLSDPFMLEGLRNSLMIGLCVTALSALLGLMFALCLHRLELPGRGIISGLMLIPMIMPPFVGAIGLKMVLSRYGALNQLLMAAGLVSQSAPPDWMSNAFLGVVLLETMHLFPIMYLNVAGSLSLVDPSIEEAARGLGASGANLLKNVTMPLLLPGLFAGASIVFIWAFTDLGTPLIFDFRKVATVQIFDMVKSPQTNPRGYALVVVVLLISAAIFIASKVLFGRTRWEMPAFGRTSSAVQKPRFIVGALLSACMFAVLGLAMLPHISVFILSLSTGWSMTILPEHWTAGAFIRVFEHPLAFISIQNSLFYSGLATLFVLIAGGVIAWMLAREKFRGREILDACAMLPLAVPGIVLAYGYVTSFTGTALDPFMNPVILLVVSYAVRRLPLVVRALYSGLQQAGRTLEEAGSNLGAPPASVLRFVTLPLVRPHIIGGAILAFVYSMLEVSDSLILAMKEDFYPMTKAIYSLTNRLGDGVVMASAMGVLGIVLLAVGMGLAQKLLGRGLGSMFRA